MRPLYRLCMMLIMCCVPLWAHALSLEDALHHLKSIAFPLYAKDVEQGRQCVGWNALPNQTGDISYYVSAGHCDGAHFSVGERGLLNFPLLSKNLGGRYEYLYSMRPVCDKSHAIYPVLDGNIDPAKRYFTLAQTSGTEAWERVGVVELRYLREDPRRGLVFAMVCPEGGCQQRPSKGMSGSPIIDEDLHAVAIMKGAWALEPDHPLGTSIAPIIPFLRSDALSNEEISRTRYCSVRDPQTLSKE